MEGFSLRRSLGSHLRIFWVAWALGCLGWAEGRFRIQERRLGGNESKLAQTLLAVETIKKQLGVTNTYVQEPITRFGACPVYAEPPRTFEDLVGDYQAANLPMECSETWTIFLTGPDILDQCLKADMKVLKEAAATIGYDLVVTGWEKADKGLHGVCSHEVKVWIGEKCDDAEAKMTFWVNYGRQNGSRTRCTPERDYSINFTTALEKNRYTSWSYNQKINLTMSATIKGIGSLDHMTSFQYENARIECSGEQAQTVEHLSSNEIWKAVVPSSKPVGKKCKMTVVLKSLPGVFIMCIPGTQHCELTVFLGDWLLSSKGSAVAGKVSLAMISAHHLKKQCEPDAKFYVGMQSGGSGVDEVIKFESWKRDPEDDQYVDFSFKEVPLGGNRVVMEVTRTCVVSDGTPTRPAKVVLTAEFMGSAGGVGAGGGGGGGGNGRNAGGSRLGAGGLLLVPLAAMSWQ